MRKGAGELTLPRLLILERNRDLLALWGLSHIRPGSPLSSVAKTRLERANTNNMVTRLRNVLLVLIAPHATKVACV